MILSTLKPQRKSVTGEDVANSLYYVHLDLPTDELLAAPQRRRPEDATSPRSSGESVRSIIPRKPVPLSARNPKIENDASGLSTRRSAVENTAPLATSSPQSAETSYSPNAVFQDMGPVPDLPPRPNNKLPPSSGVPIVRKPLGPRPLATPEKALPTPPGSIQQERPATPPHYALHATEPRQMVSPSYTASPNAFSPIKTGRRPAVMPFSLTLIRRDATTGGQWNIGKITSFQTNIPTPDTADPGLNPEDMGEVSRAQKIEIRLETSGYAKYRGMPSIASVEAYRPEPGQSLVQAVKGLAPASGTATSASASRAVAATANIKEGFVRQVVMGYSKPWIATIKNPFHRRGRATSSAAAAGGPGDFSPEDLAPPHRPFHQRGNSDSSVDSTWGEGKDKRHHTGLDPNSPNDGGRESPPSLTTEPGPGLRPRGYTFISPWEGRCEFRTSTNGRSLKCRHILDPKSPKFNPVAVAQSIRDAQSMGRSRGDELTSALAGAKPVSELRFNLPGSSDPSKTSKGATHGDGGKGKWDPHHLHGQFSKLLHLEPRDSDDDDFEDDDEPMDLSLGKEDAGGGSRGKRAKLGKLIIHDEGLKMLDLVVAANVGVWWTTWERTY